MSKTPRKPAICYGMFFSPYRIENLDHYVAHMKVTSFTRIGRGRNNTLMAHGASLDTGNLNQSEHRKADGMFFYQSEDLMILAESNARHAAKIYDREIAKLEAQLAELKRARRVAVEQALGERAIVPSEYDTL